MTVTIPRVVYELFRDAITRRAPIYPTDARTAFDEAARVAGIEVERTPEERIAAFVSDPVIRGWRADDPQHWLARKIREHFGD